MAKKKEKIKADQKGVLLFEKSNFMILFGSLALIVVGCLLMIGKEDIYGTMKITIAPILIFIGFMGAIWAILHKGESKK